MKKRIWPLYFGIRKFGGIVLLAMWDVSFLITILVTKNMDDKDFTYFVLLIVNVCSGLIAMIAGIVYDSTIGKHYNKDDPNRNDDIIAYKVGGVLLAVFIFEMYVLVIRPQFGPLIKFPWQR